MVVQITYTITAAMAGREITAVLRRISDIIEAPGSSTKGLSGKFPEFSLKKPLFRVIWGLTLGAKARAPERQGSLSPFQDVFGVLQGAAEHMQSTSCQGTCLSGALAFAPGVKKPLLDKGGALEKAFLEIDGNSEDEHLSIVRSKSFQVLPAGRPFPSLRSSSESSRPASATLYSTMSVDVAIGSSSPPGSLMPPLPPSNSDYSDISRLVPVQDIDPQILEALASRDRNYVLKLGELMEALITDGASTRSSILPLTSYQHMLFHHCCTYYGLSSEVDPLTKDITVSITPGSRMLTLTRPSRRIADLKLPSIDIPTSSGAGDDADVSDVEEDVAETGSLGRMGFTERHAAYIEARNRIFKGFQEKELKDASSSISAGQYPPIPPIPPLPLQFGSIVPADLPGGHGALSPQWSTWSYGPGVSSGTYDAVWFRSSGIGVDMDMRRRDDDVASVAIGQLGYDRIPGRCDMLTARLPLARQLHRHLAHGVAPAPLAATNIKRRVAASAICKLAAPESGARFAVSARPHANGLSTTADANNDS
ncbi:hypothetical protein B0H17DRAFT_1128216 [Mycena rosella]|uniref:R3H domain-containing protein n=1 Tax=Mycena rosella TaxID=1033263 RepID=A0AAD7GMA9_MYCRO|nr:hypothetical protein B0H17DRAFT_1128216 [Mycena rosella]